MITFMSVIDRGEHWIVH